MMRFVSSAARWPRMLGALACALSSFACSSADKANAGDAACSPSPAGVVTFSVPSGTFTGSVKVELKSSEKDAEIRYTTDRSTPTSNSALYSGTPITLSSTTALSARAFVRGAAVGEPEVAVYVARSFDATHDLPVIVLDSYGKALPSADDRGGTVSKDFIDVAFLAFEPSGGVASLAQRPTAANAAGFHLHGQSSATYDKKPYRLELRRSDRSDRDCALLGMPSDSDWVLHAPYPDKALIRNAFVYSLGRDIGIPAPRGAFAEVYVNSGGRPLAASDYQGVYLLVETVKNQKNRLNLKQLEPTDTTLPAVSGGYIFKFEWQVTDIEQELVCPSSAPNRWDFLEVSDPEPWVDAQRDYLTNDLLSFVDALHTSNPADPSRGYPAFIDTPSFVNLVIIQELTRNLDAYTRSQYFYKDRNAKIFAGPLWDYDLIAGVGSSQSTANLSTDGWQYESEASRFAVTADWFPRLLADPTFEAALVSRWKQLRKGPLSDAQVTARIARLTAGLSHAAERNFERWPILSTDRISFFTTPTANSWEGQVSAMQDWLLRRMAWLDDEWR